MINSILIGKYIYKILSENENITNYVDNKIYPIVAKTDTTYPFIVYSKVGIEPTYIKDVPSGDKIGVSVIVVSEKYTESVNIANEVRKAFEFVSYKSDELLIRRIKLVDVSETWENDVYLQILNFECEC